jgi:hypothetical protein
MRGSKLVKNALKYVPVLAVLLAITIGLLIGKDLYTPSFNSQSMTQPNRSQSSLVLGEIDPCDALIYTSFPPKCKTLDGKFIFVPGSAPYIWGTARTK